MGQLKGFKLSNVKKIIKSIHGDKCNVQALHFQTLTNLTLNHDGRLQVQHDISETDIASLYKGKRASLKFEVVCFLSNALPRYWPETKLFKNRINENTWYPIQIRTLSRGIVKIKDLFFYRFLITESREILHMMYDDDCEGLVGAKNSFLLNLLVQIFFLYCFAHSEISLINI